MLDLDGVTLTRLLTAATLMFHVIFATIGVGIPVMIAIAEFLGIKKNDPHYLLLARRWARGFTITVAVGVVTGTAIGLQLSLLWPSFMQLAGQVIALPLFMETFAFFFEAIFLGIYLYTWDRFKNRWLHWLLNIPIVIGATLSGFFITTVNAFMNTPQGFDLLDGEAVNIDPLAAMFNPATPTKVFHVLTSSYMTSALILAAIAAFMILKKKGSFTYHKKALKLTMIAGLIFTAGTALAGDLSAKFLAKEQPEKLAAAEWHFETESNADLIVFGTIDENNEISNEIRIPGALSFLAGNSFDTEVIGLNEFPEEERPPLWVHYAFDLMVSIGMYSLFIAGIFVLFSYIKRFNEHNKFLLMGIVASGPLAMLAVEFGWVYAEVGRQPWILRGIMTVDEAATTSTSVGIAFGLFLALYAVLGFFCVRVLLKMFRNKPAEAELEQRFPGGKL
ncbi:cytochrome ubiquinol oxidase subunit I [Jeotgalibacillus sp. R-1-5s-1]|uniref:cytochrome ubiquinol oxidase subunit I n=1 Tax=Jeotgalibacillus sp. R-1-5s-1 TaxID=2555897 RepID=UPI00106A1750|nr:cytochrome ubiquinol oxidase subunit I [Jeotgalibacillus sp. R-1-5s-1]TFE03648.1 cytochrome ubiquinol oxidase subunit I [Jeotgalibacillus sp. R-1-5s-1]